MILDKLKFSEVNMILETERLYLREMNQSDFDSLCSILQDEDTMHMKVHSAMMKSRNGWINKFSVIKNGTLVYGQSF